MWWSVYSPLRMAFFIVASAFALGTAFMLLNEGSDRQGVFQLVFAIFTAWMGLSEWERPRRQTEGETDVEDQ